MCARYIDWSLHREPPVHRVDTSRKSVQLYVQFLFLQGSTHARDDDLRGLLLATCSAYGANCAVCESQPGCNWCINDETCYDADDHGSCFDWAPSCPGMCIINVVPTPIRQLTDSSSPLSQRYMLWSHKLHGVCGERGVHVVQQLVWPLQLCAHLREPRRELRFSVHKVL